MSTSHVTDLGRVADNKPSNHLECGDDQEPVVHRPRAESVRCEVPRVNGTTQKTKNDATLTVADTGGGRPCREWRRTTAKKCPSNSFTAGFPAASMNAPDCAWSWVVAVACSMLNLFTLALLRAGSVVYLNIIDHYGVSRAEASWPVSLIGATSNLSGLGAGYLTRHFGPRKVALVGSVLSCVSVASCFFADNVTKLTVLCGVCHGLGMGLNVPAVAVCLNLWFKEKKVFASGIIYTGAALGSLLFPTFLEAAMGAYGFRAGMALLGAVLANGVAAALFIRMPPWIAASGSSGRATGPEGTARGVAATGRTPSANFVAKPTKTGAGVALAAPRHSLTVERFDPDHPLVKNGAFRKRSVSQHSSTSDTYSEDEHAALTYRFHEAVHHHTVDPVKEELDEDLDVSVVAVGADPSVVPCRDRVPGPEQQRYESNGNLQAERASINTEGFDMASMNGTQAGSNVGALPLNATTTRQSRSESMRSSSNTVKKVRGDSVRSVKSTTSIFTGMTGIFTVVTGGFPHSRRTSLNSVHRLRLRHDSSAISTTLSLYAPGVSVPYTAEQDFEVDDAYIGPEIGSPHQAGQATMSPATAPSPLIYLVALTYVTLFNSSMYFQMIILDHAAGQNVEPEMAVYLLYAFALCDIAGRLSVGFISDRGLMSRPAIVGCSTALFGVTLVVAPFVNGFSAMLLFVSTLGYCLGTSIVLITVLVGDYSHDLTRIPVYIGWMSFLCGLTGLLRPTVVGYFRDTSGHYLGLLRLLGVTLLTCSLAWNAVNLTTWFRS